MRNRAARRADGAVASDARRGAPGQYRRRQMACFHTSPCSSLAFPLSRLAGGSSPGACCQPVGKRYLNLGPVQRAE